MRRGPTMSGCRRHQRRRRPSERSVEGRRHHRLVLRRPRRAGRRDNRAAGRASIRRAARRERAMHNTDILGALVVFVKQPIRVFTEVLARNPLNQRPAASGSRSASWHVRGGETGARSADARPGATAAVGRPPPRWSSLQKQNMMRFSRRASGPRRSPPAYRADDDTTESTRTVHANSQTERDVYAQQAAAEVRQSFAAQRRTGSPTWSVPQQPRHSGGVAAAGVRYT